jgi:hypothetical protein
MGSLIPFGDSVEDHGGIDETGHDRSEQEDPEQTPDDLRSASGASE